MKTKLCPKCGAKRHKPTIPYCRPCFNEYKRNLYNNNEQVRLKQIKYNQDWRKANPELVNKIQREYYKNNKKQYKISAKKWRDENPEKVKEIHKKYRNKKNGLQNN